MLRVEHCDPMGEISGVILVVQESRFKLADDESRLTSFILSHEAAIEPDDLLSILRSRERVTVRFENVEGQSAAIAHAIEDLASPSSSPLTVFG